MGLTITEKIFSSSVEKEVHAGEMVTSKIDYSLVNDITGPLAVMEFEKIAKKVWDSNKVVIVLDHFTPNKDIKSAGNCKMLREFARKQGIKHFYEGGNVGIEHELLPEKGIARPGLVMVGADSHTCTYGGLGAFSTGIGSTETAAVWATGELWFRVPETFRFKVHGTLRKWVTGKDVILKIIGEIGVDGALYKAMEFAGDAVKEMTLAQRLTMCNMAVEAGAKSGIVEPDYKTLLYVKQHSTLPYKIFKSDPDAVYEKEFEFDGRQIESMVAAPHLPSNVKPASSFSDVEVDQVVIGSCTNGRYEDLEVAAEILKGRKVAGGVRMIVVPATPSIYKQAMTEGLLKIFMDAGGIISPPTCGPCLGGHMGILAEGETCIATTNRNFVGRMGHSRSKVYLASPATAAASAVKGKITDPRNI
ncbi:3-isopropylmalate dehydratase large subunit [Candidatus Micrarchaeota archaeon]|nr:3-isopropylmalate dehydratase large subunit [Candidatus Micrarchaeota archaeon]